MNKKTLIAVVITAVVVAIGTSYFQNNFTNEKEGATVTAGTSEPAALETFSHALFTVEYPSNYSVNVEQIGNADIVTISNQKGSIKISQIDLGIVPGPAAPSDPEEEPKDVILHGYDADISSALFYKSNDEVTAKELKEIQKSIKLID